MGLRYDLHIHTALSPCADDDMTPATVAGMAALSGLDLIAVSDHNSARNLPAAKAACDHYGVKLLPGIEVNTEEEIHLLCYFPTVDAALDMGELIYGNLADFRADPEIWGAQLVMDADDRVTDRIDRLLTQGAAMNLYQVGAECAARGGVALPAHSDRDAYSILSVLGLFPQDAGFTAAELRHPGNYARLTAEGKMPSGLEIFFSSDAHHLHQLDREIYWQLDEHSVLNRLVAGL